MEEKSLKVLDDNIVYCIDYITGIKIRIKMNRLLACQSKPFPQSKFNFFVRIFCFYS